jgi:hypothetical protein
MLISQLIRNHKAQRKKKPELKPRRSKTLAQLLSVNTQVFRLKERKDMEMGISFIQNDKVGRIWWQLLNSTKRINQTPQIICHVQDDQKTTEAEKFKRNDQGQFNVFFFYIQCRSGWKNSSVSGSAVNFLIRSFPQSRREFCWLILHLVKRSSGHTK